MLKQNFMELKKHLDENSILLTFAGPFSQEIIEYLGAALKSYMEAEQNNKNSSYNVFSVFVEQSQNIKNYMQCKKLIEINETLINSSILTISKNDGSYVVCSANLIEMEDSPRLASRIDKLNGMSKKELKDAYKNQIKISRNTDKNDFKGAGLGLIEIARKASKPIEYEFLTYENNSPYLYFVMQVTV